MMNKKNPVCRMAGSLLIALTMAVISLTAKAQTGAMIPSPPKVAAKSYILMDADSGEILAAKNADKTMHPASMTKMLTAYIAEVELASGNISREDQVLISERAWRMGGSTMFIEVGDRVPVKDLMKGIIIVSGNDASVAIAEHIAGSEDAFVQLMNATAQKLDLINTHYVNASGWPAPDHFTTARDLAILASHIIKEHPEHYGIYAEKYYQYGVDKKTGTPLRRQPNRNRLLWTNPYVDGLKTGHTEDSGYGLTATALRDHRRLITVIMGAKSEKQRTEEAQKLLTYGFRFFDNVDIKQGGVPLKTVNVWKGDFKEVNVGIEKDLVVTVPQGTSKSVKAVLDIDAIIEAPVTTGQQLGTLKVMQGDATIKEVPLVAQSNIKRGGFFKCLIDSIRLLFMGLFQ